MGNSIDSSRPKVVFDVDDVLWPLGEVVARKLGINSERYFYQFSVKDNPMLTEQEREAVIAAFADPQYFAEIDFFAGIENIMKPCELGAIVKIKSNSFNEQVARLKVQQLLATVPNLCEDDIQMNIIRYGQAHGKTIDRDTTIFVDDSPYNIATSPAITNIMPDLGNWNRGAEAMRIINGRPVRYAKSLCEINELVYAQIEHQLRTV